jgi:hypothetical protein
MGAVKLWDAPVSFMTHLPSIVTSPTREPCKPMRLTMLEQVDLACYFRALEALSKQFRKLPYSSSAPSLIVQFQSGEGGILRFTAIGDDEMTI